MKFLSSSSNENKAVISKAVFAFLRFFSVSVDSKAFSFLSYWRKEELEERIERGKATRRRTKTERTFSFNSSSSSSFLYFLLGNGKTNQLWEHYGPHVNYLFLSFGISIPPFKVVSPCTVEL